MKNIIQKLGSALITAALLLGGAGSVMLAQASTTTLRVVQTPTIHLYSGVSGTATSMRITPYPRDLNSVKLTMTDFGSNPTLTVDPKVTGYEEIIGFTGIVDNGDNTATLTGLSRNLTSKYPYTTVGTGKTHGSGATVVFSNNPQLYGRLGALENDQSWLGINTYASTSQPVYDGSPTFTNPLALINKAYADGLSLQGAPTSTFSTMGVSLLATNAQISAGTASSTSGAPLVIPAKAASSTYNGATAFQGLIPALRSTKNIDPNFIATSTTDNYTFGGIVNIASSTIGTSTQATTTVSGSFTLNTGTVTGPLLNVFSTGSDASNTLDGTATVTWATKSGSTYTLTRDVFLTNLTVSNGVTLNTGNFRVYGTGTLNNAGTVTNPPAFTGTQTGSANTATGTLAIGSAGGTGGGVSNACSGLTAGVAGTNITHALGGFGGAGGTSCSGSVNGLGGATSTATRFVVTPNIVNAILMMDGSSAGSTPYFGGAGGGGGGGSTANNGGEHGGGGGAGGNILFIAFYNIINSGTLSAVGGAGSAGSSAGQCSGGGGGGGGAIVLLAHSHTNSGSELVTAGVAGSSCAGSGAAGAGTAGNVFIVSI